MKYNDGRIPYYSFENIESTGLAKTVFTSRLWRPEGQDGPLEPGLKIYWREEEDPEEIMATNRILLDQIGEDADKLVTVRQKHTANVLVAGPEDLGCSVLRDKNIEYDGIVTNVKGAVLVINVADCGTLFFLDPVHEAVGIAHAGRVGTQKRIDKAVLETMAREYGTDPSDVIAAIAPSICKDCYEVGEDVGQEFMDQWSMGFAKPSQAPLDQVIEHRGEKYHIDIWEANRLSMIEGGVKPENIDLAGICTKCNVDRFYSFRGDGRIVNQMGGYIVLK